VNDTSENDKLKMPMLSGLYFFDGEARTFGQLLDYSDSWLLHYSILTRYFTTAAQSLTKRQMGDLRQAWTERVVAALTKMVPDSTTEDFQTGNYADDFHLIFSVWLIEPKWGEDGYGKMTLSDRFVVAFRDAFVSK
jgi:hypothetical protein